MIQLRVVGLLIHGEVQSVARVTGGKTAMQTFHHCSHNGVI